MESLEKASKIVHVAYVGALTLAAITIGGLIITSKAQELGIVGGKNVLPIDPDKSIQEPISAPTPANSLNTQTNPLPDQSNLPTTGQLVDQTNPQSHGGPNICGQITRDQIGWEHRFTVQKNDGTIVEATFSGNPDRFTIIPQWGRRFGCDDATAILGQIK